jgi:hypothetical protein
MPTYTSLVVPCLISASISDLTAFSNSDLTVFSPSMAAARSYISPIYRVLDFQSKELAVIPI